MENVFIIIIENIDNIKKETQFWDVEFPQEWKITVNNYKSNSVTKITYKLFSKWAYDRITRPKENFDKKLDYAIHYLFPKIDPYKWSLILTFVYLKTNNNTIVTIINHPLNYIPYIPFKSSRNGYPNLDEKIKKEYENTIELALLIFDDIFNKKNIKKYIKEIKNIKYNDIEENKHKRKELLDIFEEMLHSYL